MSGIKGCFKILGQGKYLPGLGVSSADLQSRMNVDEKWIKKKTGVNKRYFAEDESISYMASKAISKALLSANLTTADIDLLVAAGGTPDQPIPHNSALIHRECNFPKSTTPMDVNATCLSFVHAMIMASSFLETKMYQTILIVSSEKPSVGLNFNEPESAALMGDGAVAFILTQTNESKGLIFSDFETYSEGVHLAEISAGGTRHHPKDIKDSNSESFLFNMNGEKIFRLTSKYLEEFFNESMKKNNLNLSDFKIVVPHQASMLAMTIMRKKLKIPRDQLYINVQNYGNLVAASVPMCLHDLIMQNEISSGDKILIIATAAGLTLGNIGIQL